LNPGHSTPAGIPLAVDGHYSMWSWTRSDLAGFDARSGAGPRGRCSKSHSWRDPAQRRSRSCSPSPSWRGIHESSVARGSRWAWFLDVSRPLPSTGCSTARRWRRVMDRLGVCSRGRSFGRTRVAIRSGSSNRIRRLSFSRSSRRILTRAIPGGW